VRAWSLGRSSQTNWLRHANDCVLRHLIVGPGSTAHAGVVGTIEFDNMMRQVEEGCVCLLTLAWVSVWSQARTVITSSNGEERMLSTLSPYVL
jgi:hypothetical protein